MKEEAVAFSTYTTTTFAATVAALDATINLTVKHDDLLKSGPCPPFQQFAQPLQKIMDG